MCPSHLPPRRYFCKCCAMLSGVSGVVPARPHVVLQFLSVCQDSHTDHTPSKCECPSSRCRLLLAPRWWPGTPSSPPRCSSPRPAACSRLSTRPATATRPHTRCALLVAGRWLLSIPLLRELPRLSWRSGMHQTSHLITQNCAVGIQATAYRWRCQHAIAGFDGG